MDTTITAPRVTYLNHEHTLASWLLTKDHKRIGILYMIVVTFAFFLGGIFASVIRMELATPAGDLVSADTYNKMFTMHGVTMVFFVLIPAVPAILGNFVLPLMLGAKDVAFPKLNLISWYLFTIGFLFTVYAMVTGGVDTGWTFYTPYSSRASNTNVMATGLGVFITGFSSILTGLNFMVTIHRMRAPGLTWFRLPLFVWAVYSTALVMIPAIIGPISPSGIPSTANEPILNTTAPAITGMLIRKLNRAAESRSNPVHRAAVIVMPDRDVPGLRASA